MKNEFIPYEQALELKKLGFDEECLAAYYVFGDGKLREGRYGQTESQLFINGIDIQVEDRMEELEMFAYHDVSVPTFSQAFRWFRDKKLADGSVSRHGEADGGYSYRWDILYEYGVYEERHFKLGYKTYEEAELACLIELVKIVKQK